MIRERIKQFYFELIRFGVVIEDQSQLFSAFQPLVSKAVTLHFIDNFKKWQAKDQQWNRLRIHPKLREISMNSHTWINISRIKPSKLRPKYPRCDYCKCDVSISHAGVYNINRHREKIRQRKQDPQQ